MADRVLVTNILSISRLLGIEIKTPFDLRDWWIDFLNELDLKAVDKLLETFPSSENSVIKDMRQLAENRRRELEGQMVH